MRGDVWRLQVISSRETELRDAIGAIIVLTKLAEALGEDVRLNHICLKMLMHRTRNKMIDAVDVLDGLIKHGEPRVHTGMATFAEAGVSDKQAEERMEKATG